MKTKLALSRNSLLVLLLSSTLLAGCANMNNTGKGAAIGAGAGAAVGAIIGKATGKTATGAIVGAAVGGTAGAIIGRQMDKQAEELEQELEGAEVERVGEGIQITFDSAILFEVNSYTLSKSSQDNLSKLASSLNEYPNTELMIAGHTDSSGPEEYNQKLSEQRADAAATFLLKEGVQGGRLSIVGHGESQPVADNDSNFGRQQNRRVEVAIYASEEYREELEESNN
ncbi:MAG: OmpA family protein [Rhodothermaceae bacterium]|nr:OmpA family protein [Rhodothermaceae bacterium]